MVASNWPGPTASDPPGVIAEMARFISERKRLANRANARKSTGPRSDAGKTIASLNATRHGVHAKAALLPGEDPAVLAVLGEEKGRRPTNECSTPASLSVNSYAAEVIEYKSR